MSGLWSSKLHQDRCAIQQKAGISPIWVEDRDCKKPPSLLVTFTPAHASTGLYYCSFVDRGSMRPFSFYQFSATSIGRRIYFQSSVGAYCELMKLDISSNVNSGTQSSLVASLECQLIRPYNCKYDVQEGSECQH